MTDGGKRAGTSADRINALDIGRGLAIVSVIYGHALSPWVLTAGDNFNEAAFLQWKLGASFMMTFFFFVSGLGWREDKSLANTVRQALTLVLIALFASTAYDLARLVASLVGIAPSLGGQSLSVGAFLAGVARMIFIGDYYSLSPLWFLVALAMVRLLAAVLVRVKPPIALAITVLVVTLSFASIDFEWRNFYQLNPIGVGLIVFMAGKLSRDAFQALEQRPAAAYALTLIGGAALALTFRLNDGCRWDPLAHCGVSWLDDRFGVALIHGQIGNIPLFALTAAAGVGFGCGLSILLARFGGPAARKLDAWGGNSLNLLIVNAGFLHVGNVFVDRWVVPNFKPDNALFFITLFTAALTANLLAARLLERPLRWVHRAALIAARRIVEAAVSLGGAASWAMRGDRVSQRND